MTGKCYFSGHKHRGRHQQVIRESKRVLRFLNSLPQVDSVVPGMINRRRSSKKGKEIFFEERAFSRHVLVQGDDAFQEFRLETDSWRDVIALVKNKFHGRKKWRVYDCRFLENDPR